MTQENAIAAINKLVSEKKLFKNSLAYASIIEAINNPGKIVSCGKKTGSGRYSSSISWRTHVVIALSKAGISYCAGNSAPKGGLAGDNISVHFDK